MKFRGLDGRTYSASLFGRSSENCSDLHERARKLLKQVFPLDRILEEVELPGCQNLIADFFIPFRRLIVEVQGEQHFEYIKHFHKNIHGYGKSKLRDDQKNHWCHINNINIIYFNYDESESEWKAKICQ